MTINDPSSCSLNWSTYSYVIDWYDLSLPDIHHSTHDTRSKDTVLEGDVTENITVT
jgi:hypothetical protein